MVQSEIEFDTVQVRWLSERPVVGVLHEECVWFVHQVLVSAQEMTQFYDRVRVCYGLVPVVDGKFKCKTIAGVRLAFIEMEAA